MEGKRRSYYIWLLDFVGCNRNEKARYSKLFKAMMDHDFEWKIFNDDSRMRDGLELRLLYSDANNGVWDEWLAQAPCTMLELVAALASRCEWDVMHDDDIGDRTGVWFWEMLKNAGLDVYENDRFDKVKVEKILEKIVSRRYMKDGHGGLFVVKNCPEDLREVNLWYQMHWWLHENFEE